MRYFAGVFALLLIAFALLPAQSSPRAHAQPSDPPPTIRSEPPPVPAEKLTYEVEWRLIHAGTVVIESYKLRAQMKLQSAGLVSTMFKVNDLYSVNYDEPYCATSSLMDSLEGKRHHETRVTFDRSKNRADYLERDIVKNSVIRSTEITIPNCVHDVVGALLGARTSSLDVGQSAQLPVSDGRRSASVKVEAQEREEVKTPTGSHRTIRCEANLLNGVVYSRKGRVFIWLTDDARRLPVQIQLRMQFPVGTVTLRLQKEEHS